jgi:ElaA protein
MQTAIQKIKELFGDHPIKIGAQAYLTGFYSSLGFKDIGQYYLEDRIPHLKMVRD